MQEVLLTSIPIVTMYGFEWRGWATGIYLAFLNIIMIPVTIVMAKIHHRINDRTFILIALTLCTVASFMQISYGGSFNVA